MLWTLPTSTASPSVSKDAFVSSFHSQSITTPAIVIGLIAMMWPILAQVQYERLPEIFSSSRVWKHIGISMILNWVFGPLTMLGLAWACLPDLPTYRTGIILVGLARCIAMVMIWNQIAKGETNYCAILVSINAILQIILYSPYALLFINIIGHQHSIHLSYGKVAISVLTVSHEPSKILNLHSNCSTLESR